MKTFKNASRNLACMGEHVQRMAQLTHTIALVFLPGKESIVKSVSSEKTFLIKQKDLL